MQHQFDRIYDKLDKIEDKLGDIDVTMVKQEENLREHMRRTDILEGEVKPIKKHVDQVKAVFKFIAFLSGSGALIGAALKYFLSI